MSYAEKKEEAPHIHILVGPGETEGRTVAHLVTQYGQVMCHCHLRPATVTLVRDLPAGKNVVKFLCAESRKQIERSELSSPSV